MTTSVEDVKKLVDVTHSPIQDETHVSPVFTSVTLVNFSNVKSYNCYTLWNVG